MMGLHISIAIHHTSQDVDLDGRANAYESYYRAAYASAGVGGMMVWG